MLKEKRTEVDNAILSILQDNIPNVTWTKIFKGFQRGKGVIGSVVSDHIDFEYDAKEQRKATATYVIIITDSYNTDVVDSIADSVDELLDNDDLNGIITIGDIKSIHYGASPNKSESGSALLIYEVKYYV